MALALKSHSSVSNCVSLAPPTPTKPWIPQRFFIEDYKASPSWLPLAKLTVLHKLGRMRLQGVARVELLRLSRLMSCEQRGQHRNGDNGWAQGNRLALKPHSQVSPCVFPALPKLAWNSSTVFQKDCNTGPGWLLLAELTAMNKLGAAGPHKAPGWS